MIRLVLSFLLLTPAALAQEDQWLIIDEFKGLNLYLEKTQLGTNTALKAENVQFKKPGTISALDGLSKKFTAVDLERFSLLGLGVLNDHRSDGDFIYTACSTLIYGSAKDSWTFSAVRAQYHDTYQSWSDSTRFQSDNDTARAAEFMRPGWVIETTDNNGDITYDTIDYISDNNTLFTKSNSAYDTSGQTRNVYPQVDSTETVRFVPLEVGGWPAMLQLQAGFEPVLMLPNGTLGAPLGYQARYFGVADSGTVQRADSAGNATGDFYIEDNTKIGVYAKNELIGYWLHTPYNFADTDSSHWGRIWRVDSNTTDLGGGDSTSFRIWASAGSSQADIPGGSWQASIIGSPYQLISAPMFRTIADKDSTPSAQVIDGAQYFRIDGGTSYFTDREYDHRPHFVRLRKEADTVWIAYPDTLEFCSPTAPYTCDTVSTVFYQHVVAANESRYLPVRTVFTDTVGTDDDTVVVWTSGFNAADGASDFTTAQWEVLQATIPYASDGIVYQDRLFLAGDPQRPNFVTWSDVRVNKPYMGAFPFENAMEIVNNGDTFVRFARVFDWLVIFQRNHTWLVKGIQTDPTPSLSIELALPNEGCIAANSVVEVENGVVYLSNKGWRIFDGIRARDFGLPIKPGVQGIPRTTYKVNQAGRDKSAAAYDPTTGNVWLSSPFGSSSTNSGSFLYNFVDGSFSYSDEVYGGHVLSAEYDDTLYTMFTHPDSAYLYIYGYHDSLSANGVDADSMVNLWSTGWFDFDAPFTQKILSKGVIQATLAGRGEGASIRQFTVSLFKDFDTTAFHTETLNVTSIIGGVFYQFDVTQELDIGKAECGWLRVEVQGNGFNIFDISRIALQYRLGGDYMRNAQVRSRP